MGSGRNQLGKRIAPGAWIDADGALHFSATEILEHFGVENTPENLEECMKLIEDFCKAQMPESKVIRRMSPEE